MTPQELLAQLSGFTAELASAAIPSLQNEHTQFNNDVNLNADSPITSQIKIHMDFIWRFYLQAELTASLPVAVRNLFDDRYEVINNNICRILDNDPDFFSNELKLLMNSWKARDLFKSGLGERRRDQAIAGSVAGVMLAVFSDMLIYLYIGQSKLASVSSDSTNNNTQGDNIYLPILYLLISNAATLAVRTFYDKEITQMLNGIMAYGCRSLGIRQSIDLDYLHDSTVVFFEAASITPQIYIAAKCFNALSPNASNRLLLNIFSPPAGLAVGRILGSAVDTVFYAYDKLSKKLTNHQTQRVSETTRLFP